MSNFTELRRCESCGGELISHESEGFWKCRFCGNKYYLKEDKGEALIFALNRASELRQKSDFDGAILEYTVILKNYPEDEEANWGMFIARCGIEYVKDDRTGSLIPTCHRTLKGDAPEDPYYRKAIENAAEQQAALYEKQAKVISRLQKKIKQQMDDEEEYEVFISFKSKDDNGYPTKDSVVARNIHDKLTAAGIKTFFSEVTLSDRVGDEYEPIIYKALYSCKYFILVTTCENHTNAVWVKNEWARFRDRMSDENMSHCAFAVFEGKDCIPSFLRGSQGFDLAKYPNGGYEIAVCDFLALKLGKVKKTDETERLRAELAEQRKQAEEQKKQAEEQNRRMEEMMRMMREMQNAGQKQTAVSPAPTPAPTPAPKKSTAPTAFNTPTENPSEFEVKDGVLIRYHNMDATDVVLPDHIVKIGENAFYECSKIKKITIPNSVTSIGDRAFSYCSSLTSITIPDSVTSIGECAFSNCSSLTSITIPDSVIDIGDLAFYECSSLTSITIWDSVTSIGNSAFYNCSSLTSITIPDSVTSIGNHAFSYCRSLTSITIPDSVTSIGEGAFSGCSSLKSITLPFVGGSKKTATDTDQYPFGYIFGIISYTGGVGTHQSYYRSGTTSTTSSTYYIPSSLKSVTITGGEILYHAFHDCSNLTSITIGDGVTSIGNSAFFGCSKLESITLPFVGGSRKTASDTYQYPFGYIFGEDSYTGGVETKQYYDKSGTTSLITLLTSSTYYIPSSLKSVTITGGEILCGAFYHCSNLTSITIGDGVTSIGDRAFWGCQSLTSITIPDSVTRIGELAFYKCSSLTSITIGNGVTGIGSNAFRNCSELKEIKIPKKLIGVDPFGVKKIGWGIPSTTKIIKY